MIQDFSFALAGGLDEVTQPLALAPGKVIAALNLEARASGYGRIDGYERFDGRTGPTDFPFYILSFTDGVGAVTSGQTITGATSGATGVMLANALLDSGAWDGTGAGRMPFRTLTGNFQAGENIQVGGIAKAVAVGVQDAGVTGSGDDDEEDWAEAARTYARGLIAAIPGEGVVRGVWDFDGTVYGFRNNVGSTACRMYKATTGGWSLVDLGKKLAFTSGGATPIVVGDTITGATSGATAVIRKIVLLSGDWAGGDAAGYFTVSGVTGTFVGENLNTGSGSNLATIAAAPVNNALPAGGRYFFVTHNFFGNAGARAMYGCNGVGKAFEFDGTYFTEITTGMAVDTPNRIAEYKNHLFLAFTGGSAQHSSPADPFGWDPEVGTDGEIGVGSEIADFISNIDSLLILGENSIKVLTGTGVADWLLSPLNPEAGAKPYTGQRFGAGLYLDNLGLRSITATQSYGNFAMASLSTQIRKTLDRKKAARTTPIASCIVRAKDHYRLFFDDGTGLSFYMGRKTPEPMSFNLGEVVRCICSNESAAYGERVFFGDADGYVFQLDKGISFDGSAIEAFGQLAYAHMGKPSVLKRAHKVELEVSTTGRAVIGVQVDFDYAGDEQTGSSGGSDTAYGSGALWGIGQWGQFFWGSPIENTLAVDVDGQGANMSTIIYSNGTRDASYELRGVKLFYSDRGRKR